MNLFTKIIEKPVYVDTLQDYRSVVFGEYKMLDRVWVLETCEQALSRLPGYKYTKKPKGKPVEGIIIGKDHETYYSDDIEFRKFEKMELSWKTSDGRMVYKAPGYKVLLKNGDIISAYEVKKSHGEFQDTFEHMNELEFKKKKAEQARILYEKSLEEIQQELEKGRKLKEKMIQELHN